MYLKLMERDKKKFKAADIDADGKLSKLGKNYYFIYFCFIYLFLIIYGIYLEFADFLHPEESIQMRELVIEVKLWRNNKKLKFLNLNNF